MMLSKLNFIFALLILTACGNGGTISFREPAAVDQPLVNRNAGFNMVSGSQAQMIENGKTFATGYSAKVQFNEQSGQLLQGGGYKAKIKFTSRSQ